MTLRLGAADLDQAAALLREGALVAMPTETVYGLAADATNPVAVASVFAAKGRPAHDPLIVHIGQAWAGADPLATLTSTGWVGPLTEAQGACARAWIATSWPGPLTLVLPRGPAVLDAITAGLGHVALRMPAHPLALALLDVFGRPLVAPSANRFGRVSPTTAEHVLEELSGRIAAVVDGGACTIGVESTVLRIDADGGEILLRPGALPVPNARPTAPNQPREASPGLLPSHYAPRTPVVLVEAGKRALSNAQRAELLVRAPNRVVWLAWQTGSEGRVGPSGLPTGAAVGMLSGTGTSEAAARALYGELRRLDAVGADLIVVECPPGTDALSGAILDRLVRAAHGTPPLDGATWSED